MRSIDMRQLTNGRLGPSSTIAFVTDPRQADRPDGRPPSQERIDDAVAATQGVLHLVPLGHLGPLGTIHSEQEGVEELVAFWHNLVRLASAIKTPHS